MIGCRFDIAQEKIALKSCSLVLIGETTDVEEKKKLFEWL